MRILHVNATSSRAGGTEVFLYDLIDWERSHGHQVGLFAAHEQDEHDSPELRVVRRPFWAADRLFSDPELETAAGQFVARFAPDVIAIHGVWGWPASVIAALAETGVPMVHHFHDGASFCANSWMVHGDGQACEGGVGAKCLKHGCEKNYPYDGRVLLSTRLRARALSDCVDGYVAASRCYAKLGEPHGFTPVQVVPCWSPAEVVETAPRNQSPHFLFLGRLVPEKGIDILIRAWPKVRKAVPGATLRILGEGDQRPQLEELAKSSGLDPKEVLPGRIPSDQVKDALASARALVFPSIWLEAFGLVALEAFRAGIPVVASRLGGIPELVQDERTGLLANPRDAKDLAKAMIRLATDDELHGRLSEGALELARSHQSDENVQELHAFYQRTIDRGIEHRRPVDTDLIAAAAQLSADQLRTEAWGAGMQKHITFLESTAEDQAGPVRSVRRWISKQRSGHRR